MCGVFQGNTWYSQQDLIMFRHSQYQEGVIGGALLGQAGIDWLWAGTAVSASCKHLWCNWLDPARLTSCTWYIVWNPLSEEVAAGIRLISFWDLSLGVRELVSIQRIGQNPSPVIINPDDVGANSSTGITIDSNSGKTLLEAIREQCQIGHDEGHEMVFGFQMHGNGVNGARLFASELTLLWRNG